MSDVDLPSAGGGGSFTELANKTLVGLSSLDILGIDAFDFIIGRFWYSMDGAQAGATMQLSEDGGTSFLSASKYRQDSMSWHVLSSTGDLGGSWNLSRQGKSGNGLAFYNDFLLAAPGSTVRTTFRSKATAAPASNTTTVQAFGGLYEDAGVHDALRLILNGAADNGHILVLGA